MQQLTPAAEQEVQNLAQRYGVSADAVKSLLSAVSAGGGSMAQFYIPELGGGGQWLQGGMTMVGDMFNSRLQGTVSGLCSELSALLGSRQVFVPLPAPAQGGHTGWGTPSTWWPAELGSPSSSGGQNDARYAYFPQTQRLAIDRNGEIAIYDTLDHRIGGVQQQQGGPSGSLSFSSQRGTFTVDSLPRVGPVPARPQTDPAPISDPYFTPASVQPAHGGPSANSPVPQSHGEILGSLERLGELHRKGILSDAEFAAKKADLLSRL